MSNASLLIDDSGDFWEASSVELRVQLNGFGAGDAFPDYVVKNLGFVRIDRRRNSASVRFRPETVAPLAFARLMYWLAEEKVDRIAVSAYKEGQWRGFIHGDRLAAFRSISALVNSSDRNGNVASDVLTRPTAISSLPKDCPLLAAIALWEEIGGDWGRLKSVDEISAVLMDRFVLFECQSAGDFVVRDFGHGLPECAKDWLERAKGQRVQDQPDKRYGWSCALAYERTIQRLEPDLQDVDALVHWPGHGRLRRCYKRLLLPFKVGSRPAYLLSGTAEDSRIDLRTAVG
jgi:hypothetical protein